MIDQIDTVLESDEFIPHRAHAVDAGADLYSAEHARINPMSMQTIKTGVSVDIPPGYVGLVFSRSGMGKKEVRLSNCVGVIDSGYQGEIMVMVRNDSTSFPFPIQRGDRIAQLVIIPCITPKFRMVSEFGSKSQRGEKGFGSTG